MSYRNKCLREKGEQCLECGVEENIEVHHIDGNRWNNALQNLAPLCHECHKKVHSGHPEMRRWVAMIDKKHYFGELSEEEVNEAFEEADLA